MELLRSTGKRDQGSSQWRSVYRQAAQQLSVPESKAEDIRESGKKIKNGKCIKSLGTDDGYAVYEVSSGNYLFESGNF